MRELEIICNKWLPFPGYRAMMVWGKIFQRQEYCGKKISKAIQNHEGIHVESALDFVGGNEKLKPIGFICFYIWYFIEWLLKSVISIFTCGRIKAYYSISFECEAYDNQYKYNYQATRKRFAWLKYVFKLKTSAKNYWQWK